MFRNYLLKYGSTKKRAPIRPDTPLELRSSAREVISLLNDDKESETTPFKQGPVSEIKNYKEKDSTKQEDDTNRIVDSQ